MKILMSHSINSSLLAPQYLEAFKGLGMEVEGFFHSDYITQISPLGRILHRIYPNHWWNEINKNLIRQASHFRPDVILIFKGMEIYPETIRRLRNKGILFVNYNPDHPFHYVSRGSGNRNVLDSITQYHAYITYSQAIAQEFNSRFPNIPVEVLPFGFSLTDAAFQKIKFSKEINRPCFIGYADRPRAQIIEGLLRQNIEVDVYGPGWSSFFSEKATGLRIFPSVSGLEYYAQLRRYRIQLNLFRPHNVDSHNMRSFEVPAAGGIMLAPDTQEHRLFFTANEEVFLYNAEADIPDMVRYILQLTEQQANIIRENARKRSVLSGYDYPSRAVAFLNILRNITD